jgi:opacity protein-like surface antigen
LLEFKKFLYKDEYEMLLRKSLAILLGLGVCSYGFADTNATADSKTTTTQTTTTTTASTNPLPTYNLLGISVPYPRSLPDFLPVISVGLGAAFSTHTNRSQSYPIINTNTDLFYNYNASETWKTAEMFEGFIGLETPASFHQHWQLGLGINQEGNFHPKGILTQGANVGPQNMYNYTYNIVSRQVLLEGKLFLAERKMLHPYVLLGMGGAFNTASDFQTSVPDYLAFTREYDDKTTSNFSYQVGLGIDVEVIPNLRLGLGYRFADMGIVQLGQARINGNNTQGRLSSRHLYLNKVLGEITWVI